MPVVSEDGRISGEFHTGLKDVLRRENDNLRGRVDAMLQNHLDSQLHYVSLLVDEMCPQDSRALGRALTTDSEPVRAASKGSIRGGGNGDASRDGEDSDWAGAEKANGEKAYDFRNSQAPSVFSGGSRKRQLTRDRASASSTSLGGASFKDENELSEWLGANKQKARQKKRRPTPTLGSLPAPAAAAADPRQDMQRRSSQSSKQSNQSKNSDDSQQDVTMSQAVHHFQEIVSSSACFALRDRYCKCMDLESILERFVSCIEWLSSIEEPERSGRLFDFVYSKEWSFLCTTVIAANAIFAVIATDYDASHYREPQVAIGPGMGAIAIVDLIFLAFYSIELSLKLLLHRGYFFINTEWRWNTFDLMLVFFNMVDLIVSVVVSGTGGQVDIAFLRSLRVLKLAKVLRIIRMFRVISQLRLIITSVMGSMVSLVWSFVVILFILYLFGIIFVQGVTTHYEELDTDMDENTLSMFGSVFSAMLTLYMAANGGYDWNEVYTVVASTGTKNTVLFMIYIVFIQIALLNIVTGIFVENAMKLAQPDHKVRAQQQHRKEMAEAEDLRQLCFEIDTDNSGRISVQEFCVAYKTNPKIRARFAVLGLDINDAQTFFKMLAVLDHDSMEMDIDTFVACCLRLRGSATSIDLNNLLLEGRLNSKKMEKFQNYNAWMMEHLLRTIEQREQTSAGNGHAGDGTGSRQSGMKRIISTAVSGSAAAAAAVSPTASRVLSETASHRRVAEPTGGLGVDSHSLPLSSYRRFSQSGRERPRQDDGRCVPDSALMRLAVLCGLRDSGDGRLSSVGDGYPVCLPMRYS